jgi:hypothetical protein
VTLKIVSGMTVTAVNPNRGNRGQTLNTVLTGSSFTGASAVGFGSDITVNSFTVDSSIQITASITVANDASLGPRDVSVTTPAGAATLTSGFTVVLPAPAITSVSPNQANRGQTLNVILTGSNFTGTTGLGFGSGITVNSFTVDSATQITAGITIDNAAVVGPRAVSATSPAGTGTLPSAFSVTAKEPLFLTTASHPEGALLMTKETPVSANVTIGGGTERIWLTAVTAGSDITYPSGLWTIHLKTTGTWSADCSIDIGRWNPNATGNKFQTFTSATVRPGADGIVSLEINASSNTLPADNYLAFRIRNSDSHPHDVITEAGSYLQPPSGSPNYPVPEVSSLVLFGLGLASLAGYIVLRRRKRTQVGAIDNSGITSL